MGLHLTGRLGAREWQENWSYPHTWLAPTLLNPLLFRLLNWLFISWLIFCQLKYWDWELIAHLVCLNATKSNMGETFIFKVLRQIVSTYPWTMNIVFGAKLLRLLGLSTFPYLAELKGGLTKALISEHWLTKSSLSCLSKVVKPNYVIALRTFDKSWNLWTFEYQCSNCSLINSRWKIKCERKEIPATKKKGPDKSGLIVVHNWNHSGGKKEISLKKQSLVIVCVRIIAGFDDRDHWEIGSILDWSLSANQAPSLAFRSRG